jgi:formylglycine-generating enzyme required for sulfatase activity/CRP-like cAMP-binding protein/chromosome segregation ATPase
MAEANHIDIETLKGLIPFGGMSMDRLEKIAARFVLEHVPQGRVLFREGTRDHQTIYLLEGTVGLSSHGRMTARVEAGSELANHALANQQPRPHTGETLTPALIAHMDTTLLDVLLTGESAGGYEVSELGSDEGDEDWMTRMLQSKAFLRIPAANIQRMLMRMEAEPVEAGHVVVREGDEGDYYYIINQGRCSVSRKGPDGRPMALAELGSGDSFGEDALLSSTRRNATVTMLREGILMRLSKDDFLELMKSPLVDQIDLQPASVLVDEGKAVWLDVRGSEEFLEGHLPGSINLSLADLREALPQFNTGRSYIVCSDTGQRAAAAAFLLSEQGLECRVLSGGLSAVDQARLEGGAHQPVRARTAAGSRGTGTAEVIELPAAGVRPGGEGAGEGGSARDLERLRLAAEKQLAAIRDKARAQMERYREATVEADAARQEAESELSRAREQLKDYERRVAEARTLEQQLQNLRHELESLNARQLDAEQAREEAEQQRSAIEDELGGRLADNEKRRDELEAALIELTRAHDTTAAELERVRAQAATAESARNEAAAELATLREEMERHAAETAAARDGLGQELEQARTEAAGLQARLEQTTQVGQARAGELQQALDEARSEIQRLTERQEAADSSRGRSKEALAALAHARDELTDRFETLASSADTLAQERDSQARELARLQESAAQADAEHRRELEALETRLEAAETARGEAVQALEQTRDELGGSESALREQVNALQTELETRRQTLESALAERQAELDAARAQAETLTRQLAQAESARDNAQGELAALTAGRDELDAALEEARSRAETAEAERTTLREEIDGLRTEQQRNAGQLRERLTELEQALDRARGLEARLQDESAAQAELLDELREQDEALRGELAAARDAGERTAAETARELEELTDRLRQAEEAGAATNAERESSEQQLAKLRQKLEQAESERGQAHTRLAELEQALTKVTRERDALQAAAGEVTHRNKAVQRLQQDHALLLEDLEQTRERAENLEADLDSLRKEAEEARHAEQEASADLRQARQELERLRSHAGKLERAMQAGGGEGAQVALLRERIETLEMEAEVRHAHQESELATALDAAHKEAGQEYTKALEETRAMLEQVQLQLEATRGEADHEADARARAERSLEHLQRHASDLEAELDALRQAATTGAAGGEGGERLAAEVAKLRDRLAVTQQELEDESRRRAQLEEEAGGLRNELEALQYQSRPEAAGAPAPGSRSAPAAPLPASAGAPARTGGLLPALAGAVAGAVAAAAVFLLLPAGGLPGLPGLGETDTAALTAPAQPQTAPKTPAPAADATPASPTPAPATARAPTATPAAVPVEPAASALRRFSDTLAGGGRGPELIALPGGRYTMGSGGSSPHFDERPAHAVELAPYAISRTEVTFDQYDRFARATGRRLPADGGWGRGEHPVINVSWNDAAAYARWLSGQTGHSYRLPSEAEWEYAARGATTTLYWWGSDAAEAKANCFDCESRWAGRSTAPVGSFTANPYGLQDTAGNVEEWVQDCYHPNYRGAPDDGAAWVDGACEKRVVRGGHYRSTSGNLRSAKRGGTLPDSTLDTLGFRVVRQD